jgi:thiol:disulfide interchange protein DsbD
VRGERAGDFLTGVLAVLVATPCTAPFMGAALAAALSGTAVFAMGVFACLGLGLALPSLVLGFVPGVARVLPRPGMWMVVVRQLLSFPMFGATVWLLWVMSEEAGPSGLLATCYGLLLIGFGGWVHGTLQRSPGLRDRLRRGLGVVAAAAVLAALSLLTGLRSGGQADAAGLSGAEPFSQAELTRLRGAGRPVFVDVGAAWCVTCLVNERLALEPQTVREAFARDQVTLMRGDWTSRNVAVTSFLRRFGHEGVPLYVFFPAGDGEPRVLPQVLTPGLVLDTVRGS